MENYQELSITSTEMDGEPDIPNSQSIISKQNEHDEIDNHTKDCQLKTRTWM